jgi:cellulase
MDIWEANALAQALTPHPCNATRVYKCDTADECGQPVGVCDEWGCSYNPSNFGVKDYYGRNLTVDTNRKFTVTTQFVTSNGRADGELTEIRRLYVQDGVVIQNHAVTAGGATYDSITDGFCNATATWTQQRGGLARMGEAIGRGMVLIFSLWVDNGGFMNWLDSGNAGPCNATEGDPALILQQHPDASVTFSNIRWGEIGSTYKSECSH